MHWEVQRALEAVHMNSARRCSQQQEPTSNNLTMPSMLPIFSSTFGRKRDLRSARIRTAARPRRSACRCHRPQRLRKPTRCPARCSCEMLQRWQQRPPPSANAITQQAVANTQRVHLQQSMPLCAGLEHSANNWKLLWRWRRLDGKNARTRGNIELLSSRGKHPIRLVTCHYFSSKSIR
jgi:hypothetical protein